MCITYSKCDYCNSMENNKNLYRLKLPYGYKDRINNVIICKRCIPKDLKRSLILLNLLKPEK